MFEAVERMWEGAKPTRLAELFVVSTLGLVVNLVGMMAFGHHHHGHGDNHAHSHGHGVTKTECNHAYGTHNHSHGNENMHGIYLHVLADTLGSFSVIVSTALTHFTGWSFWDPLASCLIAGLIFLSSRPLVMSCSQRLLLSVPHDAEYTLRNTLSGLMEQAGVVGYAVPKFWLDDRSPAAIVAQKQTNKKDEIEDADHHHDLVNKGHQHHNLHHNEHHGYTNNSLGDEGAACGKTRLFGVVHVLASRTASCEDVRERIRTFLLREGIDAVVQVEKEGEGTCWCGVGRTPGPSPLSKAF